MRPWRDHDAGDDAAGGRVGILVSHASADEGWAKWVAAELRHAGYQVELDVWQWQAGADFVERMERALQGRQRLLAVWTPQYFQGPFAMAELRGAFARHARDPSRRVLIPVMVEQCDVPDLYAPLLQARLVGLSARAAREQLLAAVDPQRPRRRWGLLGRGRPPLPVAATGSTQPFPGAPAMASVPVRNPGFFGRDALLADMHDQLAAGGLAGQGHRLALHGQPGVGKTQLALEFAWRYAADYQLRWWVDAATPQTLQTGLLGLGAVLGVDDSGDPAETCRRVCAMLPGQMHQRRWLLIFDNAEGVEALAGFLPAGGHQLITTRSPAWSPVATPREIDVFTAAETRALLLGAVPRLDGDTAGQLAEAVDGLPLAVGQISAYLDAHPTVSGPDYLRLLGQERRRLLEANRPVGYPHSVAATITLAAQHLADTSPPARQLLDLMLFLAIDAIPLALFRTPELLTGPLQPVSGDELAYADTVRVLLGSALVRLVSPPSAPDLADPEGGGVVALHRLTRDVLSDQLQGHQSEQLRRTVHQLLGAAAPGPPDSQPTWPAWRRLLPHLLAADTVNSDEQRARDVTEQACQFLTATSAHRPAADLRRQLLQHLRDILGEDHLDTLRSAHSLAIDLRGLGELRAARELDEDTLRRRRRLLGEEHPDTLRSAHNLAIDLHGLGKLTAAAELYREVWARRRRRLGPEHPETTSVGRELDLLLEHLGQPPEAQVAVAQPGQALFSPGCSTH